MEKPTRSVESLATEILVRLARDSALPEGASKPLLAIERLPASVDGCNWRLPPIMWPEDPYREALARAVAEVQALYDVAAPFLGASARRPW